MSGFLFEINPFPNILDGGYANTTYWEVLSTILSNIFKANSATTNSYLPSQIVDGGNA